jgi:DNA invertase Pin-like site-specific DNA recombinase
LTTINQHLLPLFRGEPPLVVVSLRCVAGSRRSRACDVFRCLSRTSTAGREELRTLLDFIRKGDTLVVTRIDRLARSIADLAGIVRELEAKGAALRAIEQPIDTSTAAGRAFLQMLGVFAEFETAIRRERQLAGIQAAKTKGVYKGRPPKIEASAIAALKAQGLGATEIASGSRSAGPACTDWRDKRASRVRERSNRSIARSRVGLDKGDHHVLIGYNLLARDRRCDWPFGTDVGADQ